VRARVEGLLWDQHGDVEGVVLEKEQLRVKAPWVAARHGSAIGWLIMWKTNIAIENGHRNSGFAH